MMGLKSKQVSNNPTHIIFIRLVLKINENNGKMEMVREEIMK